MVEIGPTRPYLSIVVTTRNDDHGGSLLRRTQTFINALLAQCRRHNLPAELVIVEWNPPADRPRLREALRWPADPGPCRVRFIDVPAALHARYRNAQALPLYQMIAKNVGIRLARGQFVLATNIDIIFSDELAAFLARKELRAGCMYRIDRYDVMTDVPVDASVEEQLAYCEAHIIRVNAREGTFFVDREGRRVAASRDIVGPDAGIFLGEGWFAPEYDGARAFRWVENNACLTVQPPDSIQTLVLEVEPGPGVGCGSFDLAFSDERGVTLAEIRITGRSKVSLPLSPGPGPRNLLLRTKQGGRPAPRDPRILDFRVFRCAWEHNLPRQAAAPPCIEPQPVAEFRWREFFPKLMGVLRRVAAERGPVVTVWVPVPRWVRRLLHLCFEVQEQLAVPECAVAAAATPPPIPAPPPEKEVPLPAVHLHTNACGDFTLMAREHWFDLRGYPEWDLYSFHIDSVLCHAAHHAGAREVVLKDPLRIYHIEHGSGSGWTPEGEKLLFERLRHKGIGWLDYDEFVVWADQMRRLQCPMIFNRENWGLSDVEFAETVLPPSAFD